MYRYGGAGAIPSAPSVSTLQVSIALTTTAVFPSAPGRKHRVPCPHLVVAASVRPAMQVSERWQAPAADPNMIEAAQAEHRRERTVLLMTRRRASAPAAQPPAVNASTSSETAASQTKRRSKSTPNSENVSGDSNEAKPAARSSGAKAGGSNPTLHQNHPEDACRYPNKRCYIKRAVKNNGELHKFCDMHRDSANRYQRKLEQRLKEKRIQSRVRALQVQQAQAHAQAQAQAQMVHAQAYGRTPFVTVDPTLMGAPHPMLVSPFSGMEVFGGVAVSASMEAVCGAMVPPVPLTGLLRPAATTDAASNTTAGLWTQDEDKYEPFQHPVELQSEDLACLNLFFHESRC